MSQWQNSSRISLFLLFFFNKKINIYKCLLKSKKDLYVWLFFSLYELIRGGWSRLRHHGQIHCRQIWHCQGIFNWIAVFLSPVSVMRKIGKRTFRNRVIYHQSGVFTRFSSRCFASTSPYFPSLVSLLTQPTELSIDIDGECLLVKVNLPGY